MKTAKIIAALSIITALPILAAAQVSPFVTAQVDAAAKPCSDLAGASAGLPEAQAKAVAIAAVETCSEAVKTLVEFEKINGSGLSLDESNHLYYVVGNLIWMTAGSEAIKNNGQVNRLICHQADAAERAWEKVEVPLGSDVDIEMRMNTLRAMLSPVCEQARKAN